MNNPSARANNNLVRRDFLMENNKNNCPSNKENNQNQNKNKQNKKEQNENKQ